MSAGTAGRAFSTSMLARWSSASFWTRRFFSCLAQVIGSFGSPVQPRPRTTVAARIAARETTSGVRIWGFSWERMRNDATWVVEKANGRSTCRQTGRSVRWGGGALLRRGGSAALGLRGDGEVDVLISGNGDRIHDLFQ